MIKTKNTHIIAVTETWLDQRILDSEILDANYNIFRRDRQSTKCGGGVTLCLKSNFVSRRRIDLEINEVEAVVCEISCWNDSKLIVAVIYRAPNNDAVYLRKLTDPCHGIHDTGAEKVVIMGDMSNQLNQLSALFSSIKM